MTKDRFTNKHIVKLTNFNRRQVVYLSEHEAIKADIDADGRGSTRVYSRCSLFYIFLIEVMRNAYFDLKFCVRVSRTIRKELSHLFEKHCYEEFADEPEKIIITQGRRLCVKTATWSHEALIEDMPEDKPEAATVNIRLQELFRRTRSASNE